MQELQIMEKLILPTNIKLIMSKLLSSEEKSGDLQNVTYWKGPAAEPDSVILWPLWRNQLEYSEIDLK